MTSSNDIISSHLMHVLMSFVEYSYEVSFLDYFGVDHIGSNSSWPNNSITYNVCRNWYDSLSPRLEKLLNLFFFLSILRELLNFFCIIIHLG